MSVPETPPRATLGWSYSGLRLTAIKLSIVGAGHARDEEAKAKHCSQNIAGMARSYGVIVLNLKAAWEYSLGSSCFQSGEAISELLAVYFLYITFKNALFSQ